MSLTGMILGCVLAAGGNAPVDCGSDTDLVLARSKPDVFATLNDCNEESGQYVAEMVSPVARLMYGVPPEVNVIYYRCLDGDKVVYDSLTQGKNILDQDNDSK
jgi:hypothetical protein